MSANTINSIQEFLDASQSQYKFIDMGRGFRELTPEHFADIEHQRAPAPYPRQQHMWLGCIFWAEQRSAQHYIWFIKLPLDERGLLNQAARNMFLEKVVEALGAQLEHTEKQKGQLGDNPFTFVPTQQQLADFNAKAKALVKAKPGQGFQAVGEYIHAPTRHDWQLLSVQGVADYVARLSDPMLFAALSKQWPNLAPSFQVAVLNSLEHYPINKPLAMLVKHHCEAAIEQNHDAHLIACLRALAQAPEAIVLKVLQPILLRAYLNADLLILIAARHMNLFADIARAQLFLEQCALHDDALFQGLFADMVQVPLCRIYILQAIQSDTLSQLCQTKIASLHQAR
jgi:hypothetical protein